VGGGGRSITEVSPGTLRVGAARPRDATCDVGQADLPHLAVDVGPASVEADRLRATAWIRVADASHRAIGAAPDWTVAVRFTRLRSGAAWLAGPGRSKGMGSHADLPRRAVFRSAAAALRQGAGGATSRVRPVVAVAVAWAVDSVRADLSGRAVYVTPAGSGARRVHAPSGVTVGFAGARSPRPAVGVQATTRARILRNGGRPVARHRSVGGRARPDQRRLGDPRAIRAATVDASGNRRLGDAPGSVQPEARRAGGGARSLAHSPRRFLESTRTSARGGAAVVERGVIARGHRFAPAARPRRQKRRHRDGDGAKERR
jgi:hypothetical protein